MNSKVLSLAIVVGIFVAGMTLVSAKVPQSPNAANSGVWAAIDDLYDEIAALTEKVNSIPAGDPGPKGDQGPAGADGVSCWDINGDGKCNVPDEDVTGDSQCTVADCQGPVGPQGPQGPSGTNAIKIITGSYYGNTTVNLPAGFTLEKCSSMLAIDSFECPAGSTLSEASAYRPLQWPTDLFMSLRVSGTCRSPAGTSSNPSTLTAQYMIMCQP